MSDEGVPRTCDQCGGVTLHRPDEDGDLHCMRCLARDAGQASPQVVREERASAGFMTGTIKLAGFIVAVVFLVSLGTCLYICGDATHETSKAP